MTDICPKGHPLAGDNLALESNGPGKPKARRCRTCRSAQKKASRRKLGTDPDWRARQREYQREYQRANRAAATAKHLRWAAKNRQAVRDIENRRRARKRDNGVHEISPKDRRWLDAQPCAHAHLGPCKGRMEDDHIVPISKGGGHGIGNLQRLCRRHNGSKNDSLEVEARYGA